MRIYAALKEFKEKYAKDKMVEVEHIKDRHGTYAFRIRAQRWSREAFFCSKGSMNGAEVSVHEHLYLLAKEKNLPIIMSIDGRHYKFLWGDIEKNHHTNERYGVRMVNFPITAGESMQKKEPGHPMLEKLKSELQLEFQG